MALIEKKRVFVVDDNEMFAQLISDHLSRNPKLEVSVFHTGEDCLNNLYLDPHIVILDYYLNDVTTEAADGLEILTEVKKAGQNIHVIMLSSQEHYGIALQTIAKGAVQYVVKDDDAFEKIDEIIAALD
jgi:DNA-binding NarL/FixJ family response regulator